jgi:hypothetical protein
MHVNNVKQLNIFIKIFSQKIPFYENGGAMVKYLILQCGGKEFKSSHLQSKPLF